MGGCIVGYTRERRFDLFQPLLWPRPSSSISFLAVIELKPLRFRSSAASMSDRSAARFVNHHSTLNFLRGTPLAARLTPACLLACPLLSPLSVCLSASLSIYLPCWLACSRWTEGRRDGGPTKINVSYKATTVPSVFVVRAVIDRTHKSLPPSSLPLSAWMHRSSTPPTIPFLPSAPAPTRRRQRQQPTTNSRRRRRRRRSG